MSAVVVVTPGRTPRLAFIFITMLLDVLGFALLIPITPRLIERFLGLKDLGEEGKAAWAVGALAATYAGMSFIFSPVLGSLSDRFGRRPVILISLFGSGLDYFVAAAAAIWYPHIWILFITRAINGISGANMSACNAYIADITPPEKRAIGYGLTGAAFGAGFAFGPIIGGVLGDEKLTLPLIGQGQLYYPFIAAGVLTLANWCFGYFVMPESLPPERRRGYDAKKANPLGAMLWLKGHSVVITLAGSMFILSVAQFGLHVTWVLAMKARFGWSSEAVGLSLSVVGLSSAFVQGVLARKIIPRLGERACLVGGLFVGVLAFLAYGLVTEGWMVYVVIAIASIGGVAQPALQSITSKAVKPTEQGLLQGSLASISSIAMIVGAIAGTQIFAVFNQPEAQQRWPQAPFFFGAVLSLVAILPIGLVWGRLPKRVEEKPVEADSPESATTVESSSTHP